MPTVTVQQIVRPGAGYGTIAQRFGVAPVEGGITKTTVTFPNPAPSDPPLDMAEVAEWLSTPDDDVMAMRATIRAALAALDALPPLPPSPTDQSRIARLETQVGALRAVLEPLVYMALGTNA